jgi:2-C-methyl-D-erythritol 2,4-cyclodiphosphate synthase
MELRIGQGFDVHRLVEGRKLIVCGVEIPYNLGLLGHSDADVAIHALCDALLGAAAMGDIGALFPDNDPKYEGADSRVLLRHVVRLLSDAGYSISNADITIIAQAPKMRPYIDAMREVMAQDMSVAVDAVSVKATTTERLGFTGRGEGIAAQAVALIAK